MPSYIDKEISEWIDVCWSEHRSESVLKIWQRTKDEWGGSGPSRRWVSRRVRYLKSHVRELDPEPIAIPWGKHWPTDPDSVEALFILHHEADQLCSSHGVRDFEGITVGMARWACKIKNFFDCSEARNRLMLLQFSVWFAGQERWGIEQYGQDADLYKSTRTASLGLMAWYRRGAEPEQTSAQRWGHVFRIWDAWVEDEAAVRQIVCDYLTGHIFPRTSARRMFPIFNQQQLEKMEATADAAEIDEDETIYESIDDTDEPHDEWMDIP